VNGINIVKSDCEFRAFSEITIEFTGGKPSYTIQIEPHLITSDVKEDEEIAEIVSDYLSMLHLMHAIDPPLSMQTAVYKSVLIKFL